MGINSIILYDFERHEQIYNIINEGYQLLFKNSPELDKFSRPINSLSDSPR